MTKKRKIRNLVSNCNTQPVKDHSLKTKLAITIFIGICSFLVVFYTMFPGFSINYKYHYNLLVNGNPNYCSLKNLKEKHMFKEIKSEIINQDEALREIENKFTSKSQFISLAIVGSSGIGKSKFSQSLRNNFFWQENVQNYLWSSFESKADNEQGLKNTIKSLKNCGKNLLIVDDLSIKYLNHINQFNEEAKKLILHSKNILLSIIYIFNLPRYDELDEENFQNNLDNFKNNISNTIEVIEFRTFNETDLFKCIEKECKILNISLDSEKIFEILKMHNVKRSGCKNTQAKVLLYKYI